MQAGWVEIASGDNEQVDPPFKIPF
jgi:hypothetical protein